MKLLLILLTKRQYNTMDILLFISCTILVVKSHWLIAFMTLLIGSIVNAMIWVEVVNEKST